ncbi:MAG: type II secretion system secretin GspD, partial [Pseudomonadales bacterium]|nr:type II secretion system secretin GspD [Pseudomonadales bacterium]
MNNGFTMPELKIIHRLKNRAAKLCVVACLSISCSMPSFAETYTVNFKDADIKDLIKFVADITGYTVLVDPKVKANISVISQDQLSEEQVYDLFLSVLHTHSYSAIKNGNILRIIPNKSARSSSTEVKVKKPQTENQAYITQIIELKNVNATKLIPVLRPLVPQQGHMAAYADANAIIVTDTADNVQKIYNIIENLDKTTANEMDIFRLKHSSVEEFVKIVEKVLTQPAASSKNASEAKANIVADKRSNSLIVTGSDQQRRKVRRLIEELDGPLSNTGNAQVFALKHAKAKDLAPILTKVSQSLSKIAVDPKNKGVAQAIIEADEATNSLIITASGEVLESLNNVIMQLDIPREQVLVEAIIVEIFETDDRLLSADWLLAGEDTGFGGSVQSPGLLSQLAAGAFQEDSEDVIQGIGAALAGIPGGIAGGANFDIGGTSFLAVLRALETSAEANILSTPSLMTLDNNEAQIVVGQEVPFVTGSYTSTGSSGSNPGDPFQTIERENVGITLKVTPHINDGDQITLDIMQEVSGLVGTSIEANTPIVTNERKIETSVSTADGETIILGGLMSDEIQESVSKVPLLGDIPLLGRLFKSSATTVVKKNLMIFIRPTVVRDAVTAADVSQEQYRRVRDVQMYKEKRGVDL